MKKLFASLFVVVVLMTFSSCESEEVLPQAYVDTFIVARQSGETTVYGLGMYAYANADMTSAVAEGPNGEQYDLEAYSNYKFEYYWETELEDYTESLPMPGSFTFDVVFSNGDTQTSGETLTSTHLDPAVFTTCTWDEGNNRVNLAWNKVEGTNYSMIVMRDSEGEMVWLSSSLSETVVSGYITSGSGWVNGNTAISGETYTIQLAIFAREDSSSNYIQAKAITSQDIVWGGEN